MTIQTIPSCVLDVDANLDSTQLKDGISSMVWSTKPHLAAAIKALPEDAFCHLVNAALRLSVPDLKYLYKELVDDGESFGKIIKEELTWRESVGQLSKTDPEIRDTEMTLPPEVLGVQKNSRAGFPLRLRNAERYIADRIALVGYVMINRKLLMMSWR